MKSSTLHYNSFQMKHNHLYALCNWCNFMIIYINSFTQHTWNHWLWVIDGFFHLQHYSSNCELYSFGLWSKYVCWKSQFKKCTQTHTHTRFWEIQARARTHCNHLHLPSRYVFLYYCFSLSLSHTQVHKLPIRNHCYRFLSIQKTLSFSPRWKIRLFKVLGWNCSKFRLYAENLIELKRDQ